MAQFPVIFTITDVKLTWETGSVRMTLDEPPEVGNAIEVGSHTYYIASVDDSSPDAYRVTLSCRDVGSREAADEDIVQRIDAGMATWATSAGRPVANPAPVLDPIEAELRHVGRVRLASLTGLFAGPADHWVHRRYEF